MLVTEWKRGNNKRLLNWEKGFRQKFPSLHQTLLIDRNHNWLPKIENLLETKEIEFVLFGAMHLYGDDGILQLLKNRGCKIRQL